MQEKTKGAGNSNAGRKKERVVEIPLKYRVRDIQRDGAEYRQLENILNSELANGWEFIRFCPADIGEIRLLFKKVPKQ